MLVREHRSGRTSCRGLARANRGGIAAVEILFIMVREIRVSAEVRREAYPIKH